MFDDGKIKVGNNSNSYEELQEMVHYSAKDLCKTLQLTPGQSTDVAFWTDELWSELICIGTFTCDAEGQISYDIDFSQSTM